MQGVREIRDTTSVSVVNEMDTTRYTVGGLFVICGVHRRLVNFPPVVLNSVRPPPSACSLKFLNHTPFLTFYEELQKYGYCTTLI